MGSEELSDWSRRWSICEQAQLIHPSDSSHFSMRFLQQCARLQDLICSCLVLEKHFCRYTVCCGGGSAIAVCRQILMMFLQYKLQGSTFRCIGAWASLWMNSDLGVVPCFRTKGRKIYSNFKAVSRICFANRRSRLVVVMGPTFLRVLWNSVLGFETVGISLAWRSMCVGTWCLVVRNSPPWRCGGASASLIASHAAPSPRLTL